MAAQREDRTMADGGSVKPDGGLQERLKEAGRAYQRVYQRGWRKAHPDMVERNREQTRASRQRAAEERRARMTPEELARSDRQRAAYERRRDTIQERRRKAAKRSEQDRAELNAIRGEERRRGLKPKIMVDDAHLAAISPSALARARKKPRNCSDVRWRIELRRRKAVRGGHGSEVPCTRHPDDLW